MIDEMLRTHFVHTTQVTQEKLDEVVCVCRQIFAVQFDAVLDCRNSTAMRRIDVVLGREPSIAAVSASCKRVEHWCCAKGSQGTADIVGDKDEYANCERVEDCVIVGHNFAKSTKHRKPIWSVPSAIEGTKE